MKNRRLAFICLVLALPVATLFISCKKDKSPADILADKTTILTTGVWRFTGYTYRSVTSNLSYADLQACAKDNLRSFNKDGTGEINEGVLKCNTTDPQSQPFQWRFLNDKASRFELNGKEFIVERLDDSEFRIHTPFTDPYAPSTSFVFNK